jgi:hypothetical protein
VEPLEGWSRAPLTVFDASRMAEPEWKDIPTLKEAPPRGSELAQSAHEERQAEAIAQEANDERAKGRAKSPPFRALMKTGSPPDTCLVRLLSSAHARQAAPTNNA